MCSPTLLLRACTLTLTAEPGSRWIPPPSTRHLYTAFFILTCPTPPAQVPAATAPVPKESVVLGEVSPVLKVKEADEQTPEQVSGRTRARPSPVSPLASSVGYGSVLLHPSLSTSILALTHM